MFFIIPCRDAGVLYGAAHGAAVISSVEQERFDQFFVAGDKAGTHAGDVRTLG